MPAKLKKMPWWIERGTEACEACGHPFAHGAGVRCSCCDAAVCSVCAEQDARCPDCCTDAEK